MKNNLQAFRSHQFSKSKVIIRNDESWFVSKDLASILEYKGSYSKRRHTSLSTPKELPSIKMSKTCIADEAIEHNPNSNAKLLDALIEERAARLLAEKQVETMMPKAEYYDIVTENDCLWDIGEAAKVLKLGFGRNILYEKLRGMEIVDKKNVPYQKYIDLGYFGRVICKCVNMDKGIRITAKTMVTQKGMAFISRKLNPIVVEASMQISIAL